MTTDLETLAQFFNEHGYVIIDPGIPEETIEAVNSSLNDLFVPTSEPYFADETRVQDAWWFNEHVREIALAPRIMDALRALYGREPVPFQTLNFRVGSQQRTHSDIIHFDSIPYSYMCGVWMALEDVDLRNGPLHYYPGSQALPRFDMRDVGTTCTEADGYSKYPLYEDFVEELVRAQRLERVELKMERGQALIWSANLFHGGSRILDTQRTRLSQVTHYYFEGCVYFTPLFSDFDVGRLSTRRVLDVRTRETAPHHYAGVELANPGEWPPRFVVPEPERPKYRKVARDFREAVARLLRP